MKTIEDFKNHKMKFNQQSNINGGASYCIRYEELFDDDDELCCTVATRLDDGGNTTREWLIDKWGDEI